jgi:predicted nucleic acid-binding protein
VSASRLVAFDTPVWVAFIEQRSAFLPAVRPLFDDLAAGRLRVVTSALGLAELLTGALRQGDELLARRVEDVLTGLKGSAIVPVTIGVARISARIRVQYGLRTPDSVHIASAIAAEATEFVTMDRRLARVKEIEVRVLRAASKAPPSPKRTR